MSYPDQASVPARPDVTDADITAAHLHADEDPLDHVGASAPDHDPFSDYPAGTDASAVDESVDTDEAAEEGS